MENRRKAYILDVNCNRFYFGQNHQDVLGQYTWHGISLPRTQGISVYQWSVPEKKNHAGWLRKYLSKYSTEVSRLILEILENSNVIFKSTSIKVCYTP